MTFHRRLLAPATFLLLGSAACDCGDSGGLPGTTPGTFVEEVAADVASLGLVPFDANRQDLVGPGDHSAQYGKLPEIVVAPTTAGFDVALQSYDDPIRTRTFILRFAGGGSGYTLSKAVEAPTLGLLLGYVAADDGGFYYATGTEDASVSATYPAVGLHRANVVRVFRVDAAGQVVFDVDLDVARVRFDSDAEPLINPGDVSGSRLAVAGGQLALVHGINTAYDANFSSRHQKAISTYLDAATGDITDVAGIWCSHSFDERYLVDGTDLYELHLGDAYPRAVVASRVRSGTAGSPFGMYFPKGATGNNNTYTRLGGIARIDAGAGVGGYLTLFATEHGGVNAMRVNSSRDLAVVRAVPDFASGAAANTVDTTLGTTFDVSSGGSSQSNRVLWLTDYDATSSGAQHAERPKLVALGGGEFLVLWERWTSGASQTFDGTYAMRIDGAGAVLAAATRVSDSHLPRGDDAVLLGGQACWITGDNAVGSLTLHCIAASLVATETQLP